MTNLYCRYDFVVTIISMFVLNTLNNNVQNQQISAAMSVLYESMGEPSPKVMQLIK